MKPSSHIFPRQPANRQGLVLPDSNEDYSILPSEWKNSSHSIHDLSRPVRLSKLGAFSAAKLSFRADLKNYIPLGSLTASLEQNDVWSYKHWFETSIAHDPATSHYIQEAVHLQRLLEATVYRRSNFYDFQLLLLQHHGWIRTFVGRHRIDPAIVIFRIYVLPDDVGRTFIRRDDNNMRTRLMKLVGQVDVSSESWEGLKHRDSPEENYKIESTNNDSLFYLFNTLSSPSPSASEVSCSYAKEAMNALLKNAVPMYSLKTKLYPYQRRSAAMMVKREVEPVQTLDPRLEPLENPEGRTFYYDQTSGTLLREQRLYEESRGGILAEV